MPRILLTTDWDENHNVHFSLAKAEDLSEYIVDLPQETIDAYNAAYDVIDRIKGELWKAYDVCDQANKKRLDDEWWEANKDRLAEERRQANLAHEARIQAKKNRAQAKKELMASYRIEGESAITKFLLANPTAESEKLVALVRIGIEKEKENRTRFAGRKNKEVVNV